MVDQTTMSCDPPRDETGPQPSISAGVNELARDVVTLLELQTRLLAAEAKDSLRKMVVPAGLAVLAIAVILGCLPVVFMGLAFLLVEFAQWSHSAAFLLVAVLGLVVAGALLAATWMLLRGSLLSFDRFRVELAENLRSIKSAWQGARRSERAPGAR